MKSSRDSYVSTTNACKLCKPMGACLAFRGIEGAVPFLHGSQGCATYMRRYIISHFREPMDIASSSLGEKHAVYGGEANLILGLKNVLSKFSPRLIGVATTCLTETIGDDVPMILRKFHRESRIEHAGPDLPLLVSVSTPSYSGTHMEGFHAAIKAVTDQVCIALPGSAAQDRINLLPGFLSPADIRYLKEILVDFGIHAVVLPDISETLDGPALEDYEKIPSGGTPIQDIRSMGKACGTIQFGRTLGYEDTAGSRLHERFNVPLHALGMPVGLRETDRFFSLLEDISGLPTPRKHALERGRLIDAFVDAHKYLFGKRAVIYGEEDLVVGLTSFLAETGIRPVICASGGRSGRFREAVEQVTGTSWRNLPWCVMAWIFMKSPARRKNSLPISSSATVKAITSHPAGKSHSCASGFPFTTGLEGSELCTWAIGEPSLCSMGLSTLSSAANRRIPP